MKALIYSAINTGDLEVLYNSFSEYLLYVANKPILEHQIEWLADQGIREIHVAYNHLHQESREYFKFGERWGSLIKYHFLNEENAVPSLLTASTAKAGDTIVGLNSGILPGANLKELITTHEEHKNFLTVASLEGNVQIQSKDNYDLPFILSLSSETTELDLNSVNLHELNKSAKQHNLKTEIIGVLNKNQLLRNMRDYWKLSRAILQGDQNGIIIPGRESKGIRVGSHCTIHPSAHISPPVIIGNRCKIGKGAVIRPNSIISDDSVLDEYSSVQDSVILPGTYMGAYTSVKGSIVYRNLLANVKNKVNTFVDDELLLGSAARYRKDPSSAGISDFFIALVLWLFSSPVLAFGMLYHLVRPGREFLHKDVYYNGYEILDLEGNVKMNQFSQYSFSSTNRIIRKIPGLWNVLRGDIRLIGHPAVKNVRPVIHNKMWKNIRMKNAAGLFHLWETESQKEDEIDEDEQLVMESYYALTRNTRTDLKILFKILFRP